MIIFNITFNIEKKIHENWIKWMKVNFLEDTKKVTLVDNCKILKLLTEIEGDGMTYSVQFSFKRMEDFSTFDRENKEDLLERHNMLFRGKYVMFSTLLEEISSC